MEPAVLAASVEQVLPAALVDLAAAALVVPELLEALEHPVAAVPPEVQVADVAKAISQPQEI